jgi:FKBP-type peptidyl-prolyl cis-trans isomerase (trigger factor)
MIVEKIDKVDGEVELAVTASAEEVNKAFTDGLDLFIEQFQLGNLEGETAKEKIQKAMGEDEARDTITSAVISYLMPFALAEAEIIPMTTSDVKAESDPVEGSEFTYRVTVLAKPEFELSSYEPVSVTVKAPQDVTEEDIDIQLQMLASQFATTQTNPETGEEETIVPEITDEWVATTLKGMGVDKVEQLRDQFRATSESVKAEQLESAKANAVLAAYVERFTGEVSPKMAEGMAQDMFENFKAQLSQQGKTLEGFMEAQNMDEDQVRARFSEQAQAQVAQGLVLDAIFRHENLKLEVADLKRALHLMAPGQEDDLFDQMEKTGRIFLLKEGASRLKASDWAMQTATITVLPA